MNKIALLIVCACFASCGSKWTVSGNNVTVTIAKSDTIVSKGTVILTVDSLETND